MKIERNGVEFELDRVPFNKDIPRGDSFPCPVVNFDNYRQFTEWAGFEELLDLINSKLKQKYRRLYIESVDNTGQLDENKFKQLVLGQKPKMRTLAEIESEIDSLISSGADSVETLHNIRQLKAEAAVVRASRSRK